MTQVDLSKAKAGDTVHFRNGGSCELRRIDHYHSDLHFLHFGEECLSYRSAGKFGNCVRILDIIRIEPKAFDWADVKPGMAFKVMWSDVGSVKRDGVLFYLSDHPASSMKDFKIFSNPRKEITGSSELLNAQIYRIKHLERTPEYDVEVPHG